MKIKFQWFAGLSYCFAQYLQDHKGKCHQFTPEFFSFARRANSPNNGVLFVKFNSFDKFFTANCFQITKIEIFLILRDDAITFVLNG